MGCRHFPACECPMIIKLPQAFCLRTHWVAAVWGLPKGVGAPVLLALHDPSSETACLVVYRRLPLYPHKQTSLPCADMSQRCQDRKSRFMVQVSEQRLSDPHNTILRRYSETHRWAVSRHCPHKRTFLRTAALRQKRPVVRTHTEKKA